MNQGDDRGESQQFRNVSALPVKGAQAINADEAPSSVMINMSYSNPARCTRDLQRIFGEGFPSFLEESRLDERGRRSRFKEEMTRLERAPVREGKVDSGINVFADVDGFSGAPPFPKGIPAVGTEGLIRALLKRGYYLYDVFAFRKADGKCIIRCILERFEAGTGRSDSLVAADVAERAIVFLGGRAKFAHIWDNRDNSDPQKRTFTVNLVREDDHVDPKSAKHIVTWCDDRSWRLMVAQTESQPSTKSEARI